MSAGCECMGGTCGSWKKRARLDLCKTTRPIHLVKLFTNSSNLRIIPQTMSAVHSQDPSGAMTVIWANVEGLSANKASILSELCKIQHCHCLCLHETHRAKDQARPKIPGMTLVAERPHNKHGSSVFVRDGLKVNSISVCEEENVEFITVELPGVVVHSLYKPPPEHHTSHHNRRFQQPQYPLMIHHSG